MHLDAVAGLLGSDVVAVRDRGGVHEVLVQMIDPLDDAILDRAADAQVVERSEVLNVLAEADTPRVGAHPNTELRRQQKDRDHLVDPRHISTPLQNGVSRYLNIRPTHSDWKRSTA